MERSTTWAKGNISNEGVFVLIKNEFDCELEMLRKESGGTQKPTTDTQSTAIAQILQLVEKARLKISKGNMCPISSCGDLDNAAAKLRTLQYAWLKWRLS